MCEGWWCVVCEIGALRLFLTCAETADALCKGRVWLMEKTAETLLKRTSLFCQVYKFSHTLEVMLSQGRWDGGICFYLPMTCAYPILRVSQLRTTGQTVESLCVKYAFLKTGSA